MAFYLINTIFIGFIFLYYLYSSWMKSNLFNVQIFVLISLFMLYVFPFVRNPAIASSVDPYFQIIILVGLLTFIISLTVVKHLSLSRTLLNSPFIHRYEVNIRLVRYIAIICISLTVYDLITQLSVFNITGIADLMLRDRVGAYLNNPLAKANAFIGYLKHPMNLCMYIYIFYLWRHKKKEGWIYYLVLLIKTIFLSHTRYVILTLMLLPLIYRHFYVKRIKVLYLLIIFIGMVMFVSLGNYVRGGALVSGKGGGSVVALLLVSSLLNQIERSSGNSTLNFYKLYKMMESGEISCEVGKQYYHYFPITFMPRIFWSEKPIVSYFWRATEILAGTMPGSGTRQPILAVTMLGEAFHQFYLAGVVIYPLVYVFGLAFMLRLLSKYEYTEIAIWVLLLNIPMDLRAHMFHFIFKVLSLVLSILILNWMHIFKAKKVVMPNPLKNMVL